MDYTGYQLENAHRKLEERYREAQHTALVEELTAPNKSKTIHWWRKIRDRFTAKPGKRFNHHHTTPVAR
jgi:hypothetical protein